MKYWILILAMCPTFVSAMPYADEEEQLFRCLIPGLGFGKKLGGVYEKVLPPKKLIESEKDIELYYKKQMADMKLQHEQALIDKDTKATEQEAKSKEKAMKWGNRLFFGGIALFTLGLVTACILKQYKLETIGVACLGVGGVGIAVGAVLIGAVKHYEATVLTVIGLVVSLGIVMIFHGKGMEIKLPWKKELKEEELNDA